MLPQEDLLYRVLAQPQSKDVLLVMLNFGKTFNEQPQIHEVVERCMSKLIYDAMGVVSGWSNADGLIQVWTHISGLFLFLSLIQIIKPTTVLKGLLTKLANNKTITGRSQFMWLLLNYLSSSTTNKDPSLIQDEANVICQLMNVLYTETEPLPVPSITDTSCIYELSGAGLWMILSMKKELMNVTLSIEVPVALSVHIEFIQKQLNSLTECSSCYLMTVLLNSTYINNETNNSVFNVLLAPPTGISAFHPLPVSCVNLMVMSIKHKLADKIKGQLMRSSADAAKQQSQMDVPLVSLQILEIFSRVLLWTGTKNVQSQLIPVIFKLQKWGMLQSLLEMISHRVQYQLAMSSRFQILILLHSIASVTIIPTQLFIFADNTALHILLGLVSQDLPAQFVKSPADPKSLFQVDSDELNKTLLLSLAQSLYISKVDLGLFLDNILKEIDQSVFMWPESSLMFLPPNIQQHCRLPQETAKQDLLTRVEEEYQKLNGKNEAELQQMYKDSDTASYVYCMIWKQLVDNGQITPLLSRLLQRLRLAPKKEASLLRIMMDYVVYTCPNVDSPQFVNIITQLNDIVWKYFICPLDRLVLCLLWRSYKGEESIKAVFIIYHLLTSDSIINRLNDFIEMMPVCHDTDWHSKHSSYLAKHPECFTFDTSGTGTLPSSSAANNISFGNICLRLLPVIDLTIQRMCECAKTYQTLLKQLLDKYKTLYRYHGNPIHFLYTTLHYYSAAFNDCPEVKHLLVSSILGCLPNEQISHQMRFSEFFMVNVVNSPSVTSLPSVEYWNHLIYNISDVLVPFKNLEAAHLSWPLSEYPNPGSLLLITAAIEIMSFPVQQAILGLLDTVVTLFVNGSNDSMKWDFLNTTGALYASLPGVYALSLYDEIYTLLQQPSFTAPTSYQYAELVNGSTKPACLLNLVHSFLHHSSVSAMVGLIQWLRNKVKAILTNEIQLLYICHLLAAILNRLATEKPTLLLQMISELYEMIQKVDSVQEGHIVNCDPLCDLLYPSIE
jgi:hypothetical protein